MKVEAPTCLGVLLDQALEHGAGDCHLSMPIADGEHGSLIGSVVSSAESRDSCRGKLHVVVGRCSSWHLLVLVVVRLRVPAKLFLRQLSFRCGLASLLSFVTMAGRVDFLLGFHRFQSVVAVLCDELISL